MGGIVSGAIHDVTVSARNAVGTSPAATVTFSAQVAPSPTVPPPPPTPSSEVPASDPDEVITPEIGTEDPEPTIPSEPEPEADPVVPPGFVVAAENAVTVRTSFVQLAPSAWRIDGDDFDLELVTRGPAGEVPEVDEMSIVTLDLGGFVESAGTGFAPDSRIEVWLFSEPRLLGTLPVDASGNFRGSLEVPEDLVEGDHRLQVNGVTETGLRRSIGLGVRVRSVTPPPEPVTAPEGTDRLPVTGDGSLLPTGSIALVSLVLGLVAIARRRNLVRPS